MQKQMRRTKEKNGHPRRKKEPHQGKRTDSALTSPGTVKYLQIANILRERILRGQYKTGDRLPSYKELCLLFSVSEITIRKAVSILSDEKLLRRERGRGKGVFVNPPPPAPESSGGLPIRSLSFWSAREFKTFSSDDPAIQKGILSAVSTPEYSVLLMPEQSDTKDRIAWLDQILGRNPPDGILINGQRFESPDDAEQTLRFLNSRGIRFLLIFSAECPLADEMKKRRLPGIYLSEQQALARAMKKAAEKRKTSFLFPGTDEFSVMRSLQVARKTAGRRGGLHFRTRIFSELERKELYRAMEECVLEAARPENECCLVLEGSNVPLSYFDSVMSTHGLRPGKDVSVFLFEHYCALDPAFTAKYSAVTRPYFQLGREAGLLLMKLLEGEKIPMPVTLGAAFNDLDSI